MYYIYSLEVEKGLSFFPRVLSFQKYGSFLIWPKYSQKDTAGEVAQVYDPLLQNILERG